jgi:hypothetical protein
MTNNSQKATWHEIHPILPQTAATVSCPKERKTAKSCFRIHTCPYPGRLAYIYAHPLMIVGIDTIASDDGGHRGTGGGGGEEQGWIVGENIQCVRNVIYDFKYGSVRSPGGGEVYVCARAGMHVWHVSTIPASLTWFVAAMSAPFSKSRKQMSSWP